MDKGKAMEVEKSEFIKKLERFVFDDGQGLSESFERAFEKIKVPFTEIIEEQDKILRKLKSSKEKVSPKGLQA